MLAVPFENLDVILNCKICLDPERIVEKIVRERRGGFCYEPTAPSPHCSVKLGFRITLLSARSVNEEGVLATRDFDHLALRVHLEEDWLADVGFGDNFVEPLRLVNQIQQEDVAGSFRLIDTGEHWRLERRHKDQRWRVQYEFSLRPHQLSEFADMCHYHQTSPNSRFTQERLCTLATPGGRVTLSDMPPDR